MLIKMSDHLLIEVVVPIDLIMVTIEIGTFPYFLCIRVFGYGSPVTTVTILQILVENLLFARDHDLCSIRAFREIIIFKWAFNENVGDFIIEDLTDKKKQVKDLESLLPKEPDACRITQFKDKCLKRICLKLCFVK